VPYQFDGDNHRVTTGAVTVEPGAEFTFGSGARITVLPEGSFVAEGTSDAPITFVGESATPGYWQGINIRSNNPNNTLANVEVAHGGANNWANVYLSGSAQVAVTDSTFRQCATSGIVAERGTTFREFATNEFRSNENDALYVPTTLAGSLDAASTYVGDNGVDAVGVFSQDVEEDATWPGVPYRFDGDNHRVTTGAVTVEPGAEFTFGSGARITVLPDGAFTAEGTSDAPITFVGESATPGYWQGINIRSNNQNNTLANVEIAHGGANNWANVYLSGSARATITDSTLRDSATWGLYAEDGTTLESSSNVFENNGEGGVRTPQA
jgi:sorbitol-specific phosphotransferase system component IIA